MATLTWDSAADWDGAQSESGVVHEDSGDHGAGAVELGYPSTSPHASSLIALWRLDEDSGSTAYDAVNAHDGSHSGGPTISQTGVLNTTAYSLDGTDDEVIVPDAAALDFDSTESMSLAVTFKISTLPSTAGSFYSAAAKRDTSTDYEGYVIDLSSSSDSIRWLYDATAQGSTNLKAETASNYLTTGTWYRVVGVLDRGAGEHNLYVNGNLEAQTTFSSVAGNENVVDFRIGSQDGANYFQGVMDEVALYQGALTASEVQADYDTLSQGSLTTGAKTS